MGQPLKGFLLIVPVGAPQAPTVIHHQVTPYLLIMAELSTQVS